MRTRSGPTNSQPQRGGALQTPEEYVEGKWFGKDEAMAKMLKWDPVRTSAPALSLKPNRIGVADGCGFESELL